MCWAPRHHYQFEGKAKANIFPFSGCTEGIISEIAKLGDASCVRILALKSSMPIGVAGEADDAGDVEVEKLGDGVSGVPGELLVPQDDPELGEDCCDDFAGVGWRWPNIGIGLVVELGSGIGVEAVEAVEALTFAARFDTIASG